MNKRNGFEFIALDDLAYMTEEELADRYSKCHSELRKRQWDSSWRTFWETEIAYTQREFQLRCERRWRHQEYVVNLEREESEFQRSEEQLPEFEPVKIPRWIKENFGWN